MTDRFFLKPATLVNVTARLAIIDLFLVVLLALSGTPAYAFDMLVAPTRIVFQGGTRVEEVAIVNRGTKVNTYRIAFENRHFDETGDAKLATEAVGDEKFADQMLRLSIREVTLKPNESQVVRVLLRKPENLPDGEYRSHLVFKGLPDTSAPEANVTKDLVKGVNIRIVPVYGVSIPVIVRQGELQASLDVAAPIFDPPAADGSGLMRVNMTVTGNRSIFADIKFVRPSSHGDEQVLLFKGVAVYAPVNRRTLRITLKKEELERVRAGALKVIIQEIDKLGNPVAPPVEKQLS